MKGRPEHSGSSTGLMAEGGPGVTRGASLRYWFCCRSRGPVCTAVRKCPLSASSTPPEVWSYPVPRHQEREGSEAKLTASLLTLGCSPVHTRRRHTATTTPAPSYSSAPSPPLHAVSSAHTPPPPVCSATVPRVASHPDLAGSHEPPLLGGGVGLAARPPESCTPLWPSPTPPPITTDPGRQQW